MRLLDKTRVGEEFMVIYLVTFALEGLLSMVKMIRYCVRFADLVKQGGECLSCVLKQG